MTETNLIGPQQLPDGDAWSAVRAFATELAGRKQQRAAQETLERLVSAIAFFARNALPISGAAVARYCVDKWGGPRAQSIANDQTGYAQLLKLAKAAQGLSRATGPQGRSATLLERISDPLVRSEVHLLVAEVASLRGELAALRAGVRRLRALGPITAVMAGERINTLEELAVRLDALSSTGSGFFVTMAERNSVEAFLRNLGSEGWEVDENSGDLFARSGRRVASREFVATLKRLIQLRPEDSA